jgi:hemoglobin/transferrin/lactoferrin receptor protein
VATGAPYLVPFIPGAPASLCATAPFLCFPITSFQYRNIAKARLTGAELEAAYDWRWGFASIAASRIEGRDETARAPLQTVPPGRASGTLGLRFLDERLTIGGRVTAVQASSRRVSMPTGGFVVADAFASYTYDERITGNVLVTNLFDRKYTQFLNQEASPGLTVKFMLTVKLAAR